MKAQTVVRWLMPAAVLAAVVACTDPRRTPGYDRETDTNAAQITWTDGKPALSIQCNIPGACQTRAIALCGDNYTTLAMENMPTRGDMTMVRGPASVVVRCP